VAVASWKRGKGHRHHRRPYALRFNRKENRIKNDPPIFFLRSQDMLIESTERPASHRREYRRASSGAAKERPRQDMTQESPSSDPAADALNALSQETLWMLAVRDTRDKAAFAALFDHFAPRLKGFIMRSGTGSGQAEEIVQDVMLTVWRKSAMFDPQRAQVSGWIYQIARNRQIDVIRKENRPVPEELHADQATEPDAQQMLGLEQEACKLKTAIGRLKPDQREMIEKAYLGELTHQEIKSQTGLPLGTIKSRIRLGLEKLRHDLKDMRSDD
jgi:RNA polymerase sigma-70 factor (ECF subfamily)